MASITALATALSVIVALGQKRLWTSTAKLLPNESKSAGTAFAGLAALTGLSLSEPASPENFYRDILRSRDFLDTLIAVKWKTLAYPEALKTLAEVYEIKADSAKLNWQEGFRQRMVVFIRELVEFEKNPSGLMSLSCTSIDPVLSYEMCALLLHRLDSYNRLRRRTSTSEKKAMIEVRLQEVEGSLRQSEEALRAFKERNRIVTRPALFLEQQRLMREVEVNSNIYLELRKQYEITKIELVDNTAFLNILEEPVVPMIISKGKRRKTVMILSFAGFLVATVGTILYEKRRSIQGALVV